jgi:hypothetical protein
MTMNFRNLVSSVATLLVNNAAGRFRVLNFQKQAQSADEVKETNKSVQVYYSGGEFPKAAGSLGGPYSHDITLNVDLMVSMLTKGDLVVFDNPSATPAQVLAAIGNLQKGDAKVQEEMDEFFDDVFQILMDARNFDLGIVDGTMASRWIEEFKKDPILKRGEFAVLTGHCKYTCRMDETVGGDVGVDIETIDTGFEFDGDATVRSGTINDFTAP